MPVIEKNIVHLSFSHLLRENETGQLVNPPAITSAIIELQTLIANLEQLQQKGYALKNDPFDGKDIVYKFEK